MWLVLDSNAVLADARLEGGAFRVLFASARRLHLDIALPRVVFEEVCNHARERLRDMAVQSEKLARDLEHFTGRRVKPTLAGAQAGRSATRYRKLLEQRLREER